MTLLVHSTSARFLQESDHSRGFIGSPHDYRAHGLLHRWELLRACSK
jgi:hypothetical protein